MLLVKRILQLAIPSIATFSSMTFTGLLVLMIVGNLGAASIAVVGIVNIIIYNLWALFSGVQGAINFLVAQNYGSDNIRQGNQRMQIALLITAAQGIALLAGSFLVPYGILYLMGSNETILTLGTPYLMVRMLALIFTMFNTVFFAYMRAVGDTRTPMTLSLINSALVVTLTYVLAYGAFGFPDLGLQGAAWSIVAAEGVTFLLSLLVYYRFMNGAYLTRSWVRIELQQVRLLMFESMKLGVTELSNSVGMLVFTACITRLGTTAIAANEIALNILSFGFMPSNGFGAAATIGIGQEVGKGNGAAARRFGIVTVYLGLIFMALISVVFILFALPIAKLYTSEAAVYETAVSLIHLTACVQLFTGANIIFGGGLRGIGDTTFLSRTALALNWLLFIPLTILLTRVLDWGQTGAWSALCMLIVLTAVANGWRYLTIDWMRVKATTGKIPAAAVTGHM
ncbi:putative MATE family efflux protein [Paenibacillus phyllosphaerae]|uniref:Probable multidrug resistance protein NorM n=1 Tax=Paenibacillus phyllosphaerae TaxID=274593 RepID=A0A7W5B3F6_9BACL|nr:MATE family efflux transporter [Paenibacillus phyllosphaerae]MBB3113720.1 putative MATE family efflux protein [Paenibacillus phyllosphaerae]